MTKSSDGDSFLDSAHCLPIKGVCISLVFLSHVGGYLYSTQLGALHGLERVILFFNDNFGQLMVVPFLFFSGYGVARCLETKGDAYLRAMPRRRIFWTLVRFDVAVVCFAFLIVCLMTRVELRSIPLSWIGENLFEIYIYQRLPMIVMITLMPATVMTYHGAFVIVSALATVAIVFLIRTVKGMWSHKI